MRTDEKETIMRDFHGGETDILVATSVIEVGIDVPNSTIMLIEGADRFGLAQLHQFRGRVGRGEHQSYCLLLADEVSAEAEKRLLALEQTNDGFLLAEKDLELRGPGEFLGRRQSGLPELVLASLMDMEMLELAREEAQSLMKRDPYLKEEHHVTLRQQMDRFWQRAGDIS
jgi:ATP-dependent DNA helicase RecG